MMATKKHSRPQKAAPNIDEITQHLAHASSQLQLLSGFFEALSSEDLQRCQPPGVRTLTVWEVIGSIQVQVEAAQELLAGGEVRHV
jgi:hypothetical protein